MSAQRSAAQHGTALCFRLFDALGRTLRSIRSCSCFLPNPLLSAPNTSPCLPPWRISLPPPRVAPKRTDDARSLNNCTLVSGNKRLHCARATQRTLTSPFKPILLAPPCPTVWPPRHRRPPGSAAVAPPCQRAAIFKPPKPLLCSRPCPPTPPHPTPPPTHPTPPPLNHPPHFRSPHATATTLLHCCCAARPLPCNGGSASRDRSHPASPSSTPLCLCQPSFFPAHLSIATSLPCLDGCLSPPPRAAFSHFAFYDSTSSWHLIAFALPLLRSRTPCAACRCPCCLSHSLPPPPTPTHPTHTHTHRAKPARASGAPHHAETSPRKTAPPICCVHSNSSERPSALPTYCPLGGFQLNQLHAHATRPDALTTTPSFHMPLVRCASPPLPFA